MKEDLYEAEMFFYQGQTQKALESAGLLMEQLDLDDDDDADILYQLLQAGLSSGSEKEFVEFLAKRDFDASITWPGKGGIAVLYANSNCGNTFAFHALMQMNMDPFLPDRSGNTALHIMANKNYSAFFEDREEKIAELVRSFADISGWMTANAYGATPLHLAVLNRHLQLLETLLEKKTEPDLCGMAVWEGYGHVISFEGTTSLDLACLLGDQKAAALLLKAGASDVCKDIQGRTAAHYAVMIPSQHYSAQYYSSIPGQQRVLENKAAILGSLTMVDEPDNQGCRPLLAALRNFQFDQGCFADVFLNLGASSNGADNQGYTPLMAAAEQGHKEAVKSLIAAGAELNARDNGGNTALLLAVKQGYEKIARLLIKKGADFTMADNRGVTAGELAAQKGLEGVLELIL